MKYLKFSNTLLAFTKIATCDIYTNSITCAGLQNIVGYTHKYTKSTIDLEINTEPYLAGSLNDINFYVDPTRKVSDINLYDINNKLLLDLKKDFSMMDIF